MLGLILLDKPEGITSFSAAAAVRRITGERRVGHTGTLDPMATGVLPILIGQATRLSSLLMETEKRYTAALRFGLTTDTLDITGEVLSTAGCDVSMEGLKTVLPLFTGDIMQLPPMYSAIKKDGVRLYKLAREGKTVEREQRQITVKSINLLKKTAKNEFVIDVVCSKGTYIRTLCDDIGRALGCGAVMTALRRTATAGFTAGACVTLDQLKKDGAEKHLLPADFAVKEYRDIHVTGPQAARFLHGGKLDLNRLYIGKTVPGDTDADSDSLSALINRTIDADPSLPALKDGSLMRVYGGGAFLGMGKIIKDENCLAINCIVHE